MPSGNATSMSGPTLAAQTDFLDRESVGTSRKAELRGRHYEINFKVWRDSSKRAGHVRNVPHFGLDAAQDQAGIVAAEAETVFEDAVDLHGTSLIRHVVEIAVRVGIFEVNGGGSNLVQ